ncbi:PREDICTED: mediator of RNA polymerase II transcription subunit 20b-like [Camelina sativa]|uniref:Mediator of RNA polymerase II transcription subunit 20 n=1 Tax=Camelina sativa TaxID=90675 RepID=A0ABM1QFT3_CAMSA|nr:PREDICTED: mediator of RNA polymerase II transcription subunit 20b-like [Camelina sativa]
MPVKWLLYWKPNQGSTLNSQILKEATKCVESLNGVKKEKWKATLEYYKPFLRDESNRAEFPNEVVGVSLPEEPSKYYFIIRTQRIVMEADLSFQLIVQKLQSYTCKLSFDFEGFQYQLGDFRLRVGKVIPTHALTVRGIVMEVTNVIAFE